MKKTFMLLAILSLCQTLAFGQKKYEMVIEKKDGSEIAVNVEDIVRTYFRERSNGTLTLSTYSVDLKVGETKMVEILSGSGWYNTETSNPNIVTAASNGSEISLTGKGVGTAVVTVSDAQYQVTKKISVNVTSNGSGDETSGSLEGTWSGNMYVSSYYGGRDYYATHTEITFLQDPLHFTKGSGYWVDYYDGTGAPWEYVADHIDWRVDNGRLTVYFREEGTSVVISDFRLSNSYFIGCIYDAGNTVNFSLTSIPSPDWSSYSYWGYDSWYGSGYNPYYSPATRAAGDSTTIVTNEKPIRRFGKGPQ
jgi:hypothetical protein